MPSRPAAIPAVCRVFAPAGSDSDASECPVMAWPRTSATSPHCHGGADAEIPWPRSIPAIQPCSSGATRRAPNMHGQRECCTAHGLCTNHPVRCACRRLHLAGVFLPGRGEGALERSSLTAARTPARVKGLAMPAEGFRVPELTMEESMGLPRPARCGGHCPYPLATLIIRRQCLPGLEV